MKLIGLLLLGYSSFALAPHNIISLEGKVNYSMYMKVRSFDKYIVKKVRPKKITIYFKSPGGLVYYNRKIQPIINSWPQATGVVTEYCHSACTNMFLSLKKKVIFDDAYMVTHTLSDLFGPVTSKPRNPLIWKDWEFTRKNYRLYIKPLLTEREQRRWENGYDVLLLGKRLNKTLR